ncbi:MAG: hypothetical protein Q8922_01680 [Bacteroidota bacterium]|nr:hypothetical protein [Bacteroidota bacterium]
MRKIEKWNRANLIDTSQTTFEIVGDTIITTTTESHGTYRSIMKFDSNDTVRYEHALGTGGGSIATYDSWGRHLYEESWVTGGSPLITAWQYSLSGNVLTIKDSSKMSHGIEIQYYGPHHRIDSSIQMRKDKTLKDREHWNKWDFIEKRKNVFDADGHLVLSYLYHTRPSRPDRVDSMFYYSNGALVRTVTYELKCSDDNLLPPCLCEEARYDERGNYIFSAHLSGRDSDCGSGLDTFTSSYAYDSAGRPLTWDAGYERNEYVWKDNQPLSERTFDEKGELRCEQHFEYDFLKQ